MTYASARGGVDKNITNLCMASWTASTASTGQAGQHQDLVADVHSSFNNNDPTALKKVTGTQGLLITMQTTMSNSGRSCSLCTLKLC